MNYFRIYNRFIASRRLLEPAVAGYSERHHILPRSLGGGDCPSNLIRLTPEDHFFAHLLLAKALGGKQWAPVAFMLSGQRKDYKPIASRKSYGWAARAMARACSGTGAHQYDWTQYTLLHEDGRLWQGRQSEMPDQLGVSKSLANMLIKGRVKTALGWFVPTNPPHTWSGAAHPRTRKDVFTFLHVDGRVFAGTQSALCRAHGLSKSMACRLVKGQFRSAHGWYIAGTQAAKTGRGSRWNSETCG